MKLHASYLFKLKNQYRGGYINVRKMLRIWLPSNVFMLYRYYAHDTSLHESYCLFAYFIYYILSHDIRV